MVNCKKSHHPKNDRKLQEIMAKYEPNGKLHTLGVVLHTTFMFSNIIVQSYNHDKVKSIQ